MILKRAKANYNMTFNKGCFKKGKIYLYRYDKEKEKIFITTEESEEQDLYYEEFNILFTILKK